MKIQYSSIPYEELTKDDLKKLQELRNTCLTDKFILSNNKEDNSNK